MSRTQHILLHRCYSHTTCCTLCLSSVPRLPAALVHRLVPHPTHRQIPPPRLSRAPPLPCPLQAPESPACDPLHSLLLPTARSVRPAISLLRHAHGRLRGLSSTLFHRSLQTSTVDCPSSAMPFTHITFTKLQSYCDNTLWKTSRYCHACGSGAVHVLVCPPGHTRP